MGVGMDYQRLILAAHVNELAQKLRNGDRLRYEETLPHQLGSEENIPLIEKWNQENNLNKYIGIAYRQLLVTANIVDKTSAEVAKEEQARTEAERPRVADIRTLIVDGTEKPSE
jgi:hypothetical protein